MRTLPRWEDVVGFDFDANALEAAYARSVDRKLPFLPLHLDAANPAPDQGWQNPELAPKRRRR